MSNILIIKHGSLGDIAQASGAIQDISENHKDKQIYLLTTIHYFDLFKKHPNLLIQGRGFVKRFGILGIFLGKFVGPIRPLLPITAGSLGMNFKHFLAVEIFSSFFWVLNLRLKISH